MNTAHCDWFSPNVEITLDDLKSVLVTALPNTSIVIKSQSNGNTSYSGGIWRGSLTSLDVAQMYRIKVSTACEISLTGVPINSAEHPVTISYGANWIGFPLSQSITLGNAFAGFAIRGDRVKSQAGAAQYNGTMWRPSFSLTPGNGYIYKSNVTDNRTFTFPANTK